MSGRCLIIFPLKRDCVFTFPFLWTIFPKLEPNNTSVQINDEMWLHWCWWNTRLNSWICTTLSKSRFIQGWTGNGKSKAKLLYLSALSAKPFHLLGVGGKSELLVSNLNIIIPRLLWATDNEAVPPASAWHYLLLSAGALNEPDRDRKRERKTTKKDKDDQIVGLISLPLTPQ